MTEKKFSDNLSGNKALSDIASNNLSPSLNININDVFGFGKGLQAYFDHKKYKILITNKNVEPLFHLVRKNIMTTQIETQKFSDKIFKLYEKGDVKMSLSTLRVIEYMDDELLHAIEEIKNLMKKIENTNITDDEFVQSSNPLRYEEGRLLLYAQKNPTIYHVLHAHSLLASNVHQNGTFFGCPPFLFSKELYNLIELTTNANQIQN